MQNYFQLFATEQKFSVDKKQLTKKYQQLIQQFHPDKFVNNPDKEKSKALQNTSLLNTAYQILTDDLSRASYLLGLYGVEVFDQTDTYMDGGFLIRQIELRDELEIITNNEDLLEQFLAKITIFIKEHSDKIAQEFINNKDLLKIKNLVREMRFYQQLKQQANTLLDELL